VTPFLATLGAVLLAILSGAGGSALLELYWKPRRDRRRAASLIQAEVLLNAQLILLQAHARQQKPRAIPRDFRMSHMAWDASSSIVSELDPGVLKRLVLLYNRFETVNELVPLYADASDQLDACAADAPKRPKLTKYVNSIIDVFNTTLDSAFDDSKVLLPSLLSAAGIPLDEGDSGPTRDYASDVRKLLSEREKRLKALEEMGDDTASGT
jgi:hypothetical protein